MNKPNTKDFTKLSRHVYFILGCNRGRYPYSNSIIIYSDKNYLIDSGLCLQVLDKFRHKVDIVLYSHWHEDHVSYNQLFRMKYIHSLDKPAVEDPDIFCSRYPFPYEDCKRLIEFFMLSFTKESFRVFHDNDKFSSGNVEIEILHTPGHALGHTSFLVKDDINILFMSDIDLSSFGPWYGGLDCNVTHFIESIKRIMKIIEDYDIDIAVSSHTGIHRDKERILNRLGDYLNIIFDREKKIRKFIERGFNVDGIIGKGIIYREISKKDYRFYAEKRMIEQHVKRILKD